MEMELDADGRAVIYRVEHTGPLTELWHERNAGPFTGPGSRYTYEQYRHWFNRMPTPWQDEISMREGMVCGFPSWEKLRYWMRHSRVPGSLQRHGYSVRVFVVNPKHVEVGKSGHQCTFKRAEAEIVATIKPKEALL